MATDASNYSYVSINGVKLMLNEIVTLRFDDNNKKLVIYIKATPEKKLINAAKTTPTTIKFIQKHEETAEDTVIIDFTSSNATCRLEHVGTMFAEVIEVVSDVPIF
jgi:hypothetical protein